MNKKRADWLKNYALRIIYWGNLIKMGGLYLGQFIVCGKIL